VRIGNEAENYSLLPPRGENILLFLVQTTGRQMVEQRQYRAARRGAPPGLQRKTEAVPDFLDMPDRDLQPPRFCRLALEQLLDDWSAVKAMVMSGVGESVDEQSGTALLDKFTYKLLVKCSTEVTNYLSFQSHYISSD